MVGFEALRPNRSPEKKIARNFGELFRSIETRANLTSPAGSVNIVPFTAASNPRVGACCVIKPRRRSPPAAAGLSNLMPLTDSSPWRNRARTGCSCVENVATSLVRPARRPAVVAVEIAVDVVDVPRPVLAEAAWSPVGEIPVVAGVGLRARPPTGSGTARADDEPLTARRGVGAGATKRPAGICGLSRDRVAQGGPGRAGGGAWTAARPL